MTGAPWGIYFILSYQFPKYTSPRISRAEQGSPDRAYKVRLLFRYQDSSISLLARAANMLNLRGKALRLAIATSSGSAYLLFGYDQVRTVSARIPIPSNRLIGRPRRSCLAAKLSLGHWKSHFRISWNNCCSF